METEHLFRIEVWDDPPDAGGELIEVIASSSSFPVSSAALKVAIRERPGKYIVHMNGRHRMSCELAPDPPELLKPPKVRTGPDPYPEVLDDPEYTFATLPEWKTLAIHCKSCDRVAPVDRWEMARKHGKQRVITMLLPKLRCQCGVKGNSEWRMGMMPR
ncbi:hypothetical protein [Agrobacterium pusense]|uniref:hypothetical protein n=1 Tax=Agrobacterium pusense TaxID=648995 RepID=UPI000D353966|nr:hypothetical protein [Agrobacterium pusense]PTV70217.1 hypothetical protein DBL06_25475 [Agrobacterium pusense]